VRYTLTLMLTIAAGLAPATTASAGHRDLRVPTGSDQQYRGLDAVDRHMAWVGGSDGQVMGTTG
jgi:hypothetical protein